MFGHTRGGVEGGSVSKHWFFLFFWLFSMVFWFFLVFFGFLLYCLQVHSTSAECIAIWQCPTSKMPNVLRFGNAVFQNCRMYCDLAMQLSKSAECTAFWQCRCPKVQTVQRFGNALADSTAKNQWKPKKNQKTIENNQKNQKNQCLATLPPILPD